MELNSPNFTFSQQYVQNVSRIFENLEMNDYSAYSEYHVALVSSTSWTSPTPISTYRYSLEPLHSIPRPYTRSETPFYKTPTCSHTQSHWRFSSTFPPSCPRLNITLTQQTHSLQATDSPPYSLMLPPSGVTHHFPIIDISKYYNPNVLELSVTTPDVLLFSYLHSILLPEPIHKFIYRLTENFFHNCSTHPNPLVCQIGNYTLSDLHTHSIENIYTNGLNIFYCKPHPATAVVFYIVINSHCWYLYVFYTHLRE